MLITSDDIAEGRVAPKPIENGVIVPPSLQANAETLLEHQHRMLREGRGLISKELARQMRFTNEEIVRWFDT